MDQMAQPIPSYARIIPVPGPVNHKRFSLYLRQIHKFPEPAIITVVAIVSHDKQRMGRDRDRAEIVSRPYCSWDDVGIRMGPVFVFHGFVVQEYLFIPDFKNISFNANNPFDEILFWIFGELEYDHILPFRIRDRNYCFIQKRYLYAVDEFVHEDVVSYQKGWLHGTRGNLKCLHDKGPDKQGQNDGNQDGL